MKQYMKMMKDFSRVYGDLYPIIYNKFRNGETSSLHYRISTTNDFHEGVLGFGLELTNWSGVMYITQDDSKLYLAELFHKRTRNNIPPLSFYGGFSLNRAFDTDDDTLLHLHDDTIQNVFDYNNQDEYDYNEFIALIKYPKEVWDAIALDSYICTCIERNDIVKYECKVSRISAFSAEYMDEIFNLFNLLLPGIQYEINKNSKTS